MSVGAAIRSTYWTENPQGAGHLRGTANAPGLVKAGFSEIRQIGLVSACVHVFPLLWCEL